MRKWVVLLVGAAALAVGAYFFSFRPPGLPGQTPAPTVEVGESVIAYSDISREGTWTATERLWSWSPTDGNRTAKIVERDGLTLEGADEIVKDCSEVGHLCRKSETMMVAVPRRGVSMSQTYESGGVIFTVEECEHPLDGICGIALIRGECWHAGGGFPECSPQRTSERDTRSLVFFLFNRSLGVTAMGTAAKMPQTRAEKIEVVSQKILLGPAGLLQLKPQYR